MRESGVSKCRRVRRNVHDDCSRVLTRKRVFGFVGRVRPRNSRSSNGRRGGNAREICKAKATECNNDKTSMRGEK